MTTIQPLDAVTAGLGAAGTALHRVDTDRLAELAADLADSDFVSSAASSAASAVELVNEQMSTILEHGRRSSRNTQIALAAGAVVLVVGGVILIRRRKRGRDEFDATSSNGAA